MIFNSIRWQLQIWHGLLLLGVLTGFGLTAYHVARNDQMRRLDQEIEQRLGMLFRPTGPGPGTERPAEMRMPPPAHDDREFMESPSPDRGPRRGRPRRGGEPDFFRERIRESIQRVMLMEEHQTNGMYAVFWDENSSVLARTTGAPADIPLPLRPHVPPTEMFEPMRGPGTPFAPGSMGFPTFRTVENRREAYRFLPFGECLLVGRSMAPEQAAMRRLAISLTSAGLGVLALGLAGGWWLATRAIKPIDVISATAAKISGGDLSQRIDAENMQDELGRLATVLNSTFARLDAAFANQARFTSDASHELRTPLTVILTQIQTALARERSSEDYRGALQACQRAAHRMRQLIDSLLALARLDAGQDAMRLERVDLERLVRDCVDLLQPLATERGVRLQTQLQAATVNGDPDRLAQVVANLVSNATDFNRPGGEVRISTSVENGAALLKVADTGEGIPAEDLPHIFERFYRVDKSRSRVKGHAGLGLAICKAIVEAHAGSIHVKSTPAEGSEFVVSIPLAQESEATARIIAVQS